MKCKLLVGIASVASLVALAACEDQTTTASGEPNEPAATAPTEPAGQGAVSGTMAKGIGTIATAQSTDAREFAQTAAMDDMFEIEASRVALARSQSPDVKAFAQDMIDAHTRTSEDLKAMLVRAGLIIELPAMLDNEHKQMIDDLRAASAQELDARYIAQLKEAHDEALKLYRDYAMNGMVADLKALAADTVPKIEMHVQKTAELESKHRTQFSKAESR